MFPFGLYLGAKAGNAQSRQALFALAQNAAYATNVPEEWMAGINRSREVAYNLMSKLLAQELGANNQDQIDRLVWLALGHMDQWFATRTAAYMQPFMVALTSEALIMYHHKTGDTRVVPAIRRAADYLWAHLWRPEARAFLYINTCIAEEGGCAAVRPAPDLNLLIVPLWGWLYAQTGEAKYQQQGAQILVGGVGQAGLDQGKQFNQNYNWSADYVA